MTPIANPVVTGSGVMDPTTSVNPLARTHRMTLCLTNDVFAALPPDTLTLFLALSQLTLPLPLLALGAFLAPLGALLALLGTLLILLLPQRALALSLLTQSALALSLTPKLLLTLPVSFDGPATVLFTAQGFLALPLLT